MKSITLNKSRIKTAIAAVIFSIVFTSCWDDFDDKLVAPTNEAPQVKMSSNCTLTATDAALEWAEPDAVAYMGMKIICTGNGTTTETTLNRGTTAYTITGLSSSYEYTITLAALYSTGYQIESSKFSVTPTAKTMRFIYTAAELNDVRNGGLGDYCILMADIDLSGYSNGTGWNPISTFTGIFDGNGHTIRNLTINDSTGNYKGLFGQTSGSTIKNLGLNNVSVTGYQWVGGLAGSSGAGTTTNCYVNGTVNGAYQYIGGLIGQLTSGTITYCYSTGSVTGTFQGVGGLVGFNVSGISECHSSANVSGGISTGGLVGNNQGSISKCYATGSVNGSSSTGGLVGYVASTATINNCYATGNVLINTYRTGNGAYAGGLAGFTNATVEKCSALGDVTVQFSLPDGSASTPVNAGGLVGRMFSGVSIINCFARGDVDARYTGTDVEISVFAGGLAGYSNRPVQYSYSTGSVFADSKGGVAVYKGFAGASGALTDCYYDKDTSGHNDTGTGYTYLTTSQMKDLANYSGWDFAAIWAISGSVNNGYPYLRPAP